MEPSISFGDQNGGYQIAINHGPIEAHLHIENITAIRPLAHTIYKSLFNAPDQFTQVRNELGLLISVLNATEEHLPEFRPHDPQIPQLNDALSGCRTILQDLQRLKEHFDNIGSQTQITWERMGWGLEELADIRGKFSLQIQMLNLLNTNMLRSSHENVERMLKTFISEIRSGKRDSAAMSTASTGSLTLDEKEAWRNLRKELQSIGITPDIFNQHRQFIIGTLQNLLIQGDIEDCAVPLTTEKGNESNTSTGETDQYDESEDKRHSETKVWALPYSATEEIPSTRSQIDIPAQGSGSKLPKRLHGLRRKLVNLLRQTPHEIAKTIPEASAEYLGPLGPPSILDPEYLAQYAFCQLCLSVNRDPDPALADQKTVPGGLGSGTDQKYLLTDCGHRMHEACLKEQMDYPSRCPICRSLISHDVFTLELPSPKLKIGEIIQEIESQASTKAKEPLTQTPTDKKDPETGQPAVLFTVATLFTFNLFSQRLEDGYPYLTYESGEIFSVIDEKVIGSTWQSGVLWLAFNQDDPEQKLGWLWDKHCAKLCGSTE